MTPARPPDAATSGKGKRPIGPGGFHQHKAARGGHVPRAKAPVYTGYHRCPGCGERVIWPIGKKAKRMPPVSYWPDPAGTVAVEHTARGAWRGRILSQGDAPMLPEKRYRWHRETCRAGQEDAR